MPWRNLRVPVGQAWAGAGQRKKEEGRKEKRRLFYGKECLFTRTTTPWIARGRVETMYKNIFLKLKEYRISNRER